MPSCPRRFRFVWTTLLLVLSTAIANCAEVPTNQRPLLEREASPSFLKPIEYSSFVPGNQLGVSAIQIRIQPTERREFEVRIQTLVRIEQQTQIWDFEYKGFVTTARSDDGQKTIIRSFIESISGTRGSGRQDHRMANPLLVHESTHNSDNSFHQIEIPLILKIVEPSLADFEREALIILSQNFGFLTPINSQRLQIGSSIWASGAALERQFQSELFPALRRSATLRAAFEPEARKSGMTYERYVDGQSEAIRNLLRSITNNVTVLGTVVQGGREGWLARGPSSLDSQVRTPEGIVRVTANGQSEMVVDPFSGQSLRQEMAVTGSFQRQGKRFIFEQKLSATIRALPPRPPVFEPPPQTRPEQQTRPSAAVINPGEPKRISEIYASASRSIFAVRTGESIGTAFAIGPNLLLTNRHVVAGTNEIELSQNGQKVQMARVERIFDGDMDLAVLRTSGPISSSPLALANEIPPIGTEILIIGTPRGLEGSLTGGLVSQVRFLKDIGFIQIDAPMNPGNSGSPVLDRYGRVVGIATLAGDASKGVVGIGFAISSESIRSTLSKASLISNSFHGEALLGLLTSGCDTEGLSRRVGANCTSRQDLALGNLVRSHAEKAPIR